MLRESKITHESMLHNKIKINICCHFSLKTAKYLILKDLISILCFDHPCFQLTCSKALKYIYIYLEIAAYCFVVALC